MPESTRKRTKYLTLCAMLTALGVVLMALGSIIDVLDLSVAVLASMLCIYAVIEMGGFYPWALWGATSILSLILLPVKTPALFYAAFAGFYPIVKEKLERLPRAVAWILKAVVFHLSLGAIVLTMRLFLPGQLTEEIPYFGLILYALALVTFFLYDFALTRLITFYLVRLRHRFGIR